MKLEDMNLQQLHELSTKVEDLPEGLKLMKDGKPFDLEDYIVNRAIEFFDAPEETVQQLVGRCFKSPFGGNYMIKILGLRSDRDNKYWNDCKLWQEFIYEKVEKYRDGWCFPDYSLLQESEELKAMRITPFAEINYASEEMFNIGKDGNLYVDYWCNRDYSKLIEVDPKTFNKHRAEAYEKWSEEQSRDEDN
jgi:hypothetical protein